MVADRGGRATAYALDNLGQRGELFIEPGERVYEGMVVGVTPRPGDLVVNVTRDKQKTNIRTHSHDEAVKLAPPREITLESAMELVEPDELIEVTPDSIRLRKRLLRESERRRHRR